ncbi:MAG: hypothetical protein EHM37_24425 [Deltaproteobacteria bacterium]|nr:MAG: hypothetical protein EHM37_24425 [Deltaproteobacteria bacterium]
MYPSILTITLCFMAVTASYTDPLRQLADSLPQKVNGWTVEGEDRYFDEKSIFDYIDGSGEVYRAYNLRQCMARAYSKEGSPGIVLDLFDMGTSADAFGVFTHDLEGEVVAIGQDGRWRPGWLNFWKDRFFVSITIQEENAQAFEAALELGRQVAALVPKKGDRPKLLERLPQKGLQRGTVRFLHHPIVLNYHFYLSDENILDLSPQTDAVLATYQKGKHSARLLLVHYPNAKLARKAAENIRRHYLPDADADGMARLENGKWASSRLTNQLLILVLEAGSREFSADLVREVN